MQLSGDRDASSQAAVAAAVRERGLAAAGLDELARASNVNEDVAREALAALAAADAVLAIRRPPAYVDGVAAHELLHGVLKHLDEAVRAEPWAMGLTSLGLARMTGVQEPLLIRILAEFVQSGRLANRAGYYATPDHRASLTPAQTAFFAELVPAGASQACLPVPFAGIAEAVRRSPLPGASKAFDTLLACGALVKVGSDLYRGSQIEVVRARVEAYLRHNERMTVAQFRDLLETSRKYALPLLEWFDAHGVTLRSGDYRTLGNVTRPAGRAIDETG